MLPEYGTKLHKIKGAQMKMITHKHQLWRVLASKSDIQPLQGCAADAQTEN